MTDSVNLQGEIIGFAHGRAQVRLERASGCGACSSRGSCASGGAMSQVIDMPLSPDARVGDQITVSIPTDSLTLAALFGYLLPPVSLLLGAIAGNLVFGSDLAAVLGAGLGLVVGVLLARLSSILVFGKNFSSGLRRPNFQPGDHS
jgi:sigma-E factor negative regulatory protein RseC